MFSVVEDSFLAEGQASVRTFGIRCEAAHLYVPCVSSHFHIVDDFVRRLNHSGISLVPAQDVLDDFIHSLYLP